MHKMMVIVVGSLRKTRPICINTRMPLEFDVEQTATPEDARLRVATKSESFNSEHYERVLEFKGKPPQRISPL